MGSLNLKLNSSTCSSLLLWSAALLWPLPSPRLRLMLMPSMVLTAMVLVDSMEDMDTLVLAMPDTDMLLLMPMVLTMERGLLTLSPRLMPTMVLTVLATAMVVSMEDMESVPMVPTPMPMVLTTARGQLMLSPRMMLMLSMVLMVLAMAMVDTVLAMLDMPVLAMLDTPLPMPMVLTMARGLPMLSPRLMPTMVPMVLVMAMVDFMEDMESVPMVPTPMPMVSMESKITIPSTNRVAHQVQTEAQKQTFEINLTFSTIS